MNTYTRVLLAVTLSVTLFSCTKDEIFPPIPEPPTRPTRPTNPTNPGTNNDIIGAYDFISLSAATKSTSTANIAGENSTTITRSNYTTTDNEGVFTISKDKATFSNFSYAINSKAEAWIYINGVQQGPKMEMPFDFMLPQMNSESPIRIISKDSIYFEKGMMALAEAGPGGEIESQASGCKYSISNDTLVFFGTTRQVKSLQDMGFTMNINSEASFVIKYKRKK